MINSLVSVCIPTYNGEKYLRECLNTVLAQTYENIEILIVDDLSADETVKIVNEYLIKDKRIKFYRNECNLGLVGNWNKCIELAKGEWIKFVFQDDCISPVCVEKMMANTCDNALVVCKRTFLVDEADDSATKRYYEKEVMTFENTGIVMNENFISSKKISKAAAENICMNFIGEPTSILFKKGLISSIGLFNTDLAQICDLEYCLRIATNYGVSYVSEPLTRLRIHSSSTTNSNLKGKFYVLANIDPIILVHQLLYDAHYSKFRKEIIRRSKNKLKKYFAVRVYEAYETAKTIGLQSVEMKKFLWAAESYPEIELGKYPTFYTKLMYSIVKLRRKFRSR